jgi:hypothetical protein
MIMLKIIFVFVLLVQKPSVSQPEVSSFWTDPL